MEELIYLKKLFSSSKPIAMIRFTETRYGKKLLSRGILILSSMISFSSII